ncbi:aminoacetone oxidase family FAD-binding enzyme [bacterium]|nr:aminoacetone oxidase family FAD-binding enzyme [bacterium]
MVHASTSSGKYKTVAIIGGGPAGCICANYLQDSFDVTLFDKSNFLRTLLPTGGGRCNLAHSEYDFKELAKNYPRGEKFLYSVFSRFGTADTIDFFESIGIKTYTQEDNRIFPVSNSAKDVREKMLNSLSKTTFVKEKVITIEQLDNCWKLKTDKSSYAFDIIVVAIGGHVDFDFLKELDINIVPPTQSLVGLITKENFADIAGVCINNILFTHKGVSGPYIYTISSINARKEMPYKLNLKLIEEFNLQEHLDKNSHKEIKNLLGQFVPKALAVWVLNSLNISPETPCHKIDGKTRDKILNKLTNFEVTVTGKVLDSEVVTCGGIDLKEINAKTLESKTYSGLYFCGEVLDIDGFCGGFNLQNCWSTGYVVSQSILNL